MPEPVHILSLGAGVQSSTLALMAAAGLVTPMPMAAIFADTQAEPPSVYRWLDWLEKQLPFPVHRVTAGNLWESAVTHKTAIPFSTVADNGDRGMMHMSCTRDYKIRPIMARAKLLTGVIRGQKSVSVIQWIGISIDEIARCKPSADKWWSARWPLIENRMTRNACLDWMADRGYPVPPRSACVFCPFHSIREWRRLRDDEPDEFAKAVQFEKDAQQNASGKLKTIPFLHRSRVPLDQVDLRTDAEHGQASLWQDECEGMCGV